MPREHDPTPRRPKGRPKKADAPVVNYAELDRLLVFGEVVAKEGGTSRVDYPTYRELAARFGISRALVAEYARKHNCMQRRREAEGKLREKAEEKIIERRATHIALSREDEIRIIDTYLRKFLEAVEEGRVRFDDPNDFDTMLRLKGFWQGGADTRQEVHTTITLEDIQERHRLFLERSAFTTPALSGTVPRAPEDFSAAASHAPGEIVLDASEARAESHGTDDEDAIVLDAPLQPDDVV